LFTGSNENPYGNIYHEVIQQNIAINGIHQGVAVELSGEELIFDNINHQGISMTAWLDNLYCVAKEIGEDFQITKTDF
jgi:Papain fold toxin 2